MAEVKEIILVLFLHGCLIASAARDAHSPRRVRPGDNHVPDESFTSSRKCGDGGDACDDKPNIIFILTDDQDVTMDAISPMTNTLNLLGKQGMTFTNMFTTSPLCCPSRSSILTGNYIHNHGAMNNSLSGNCSSTSWQQGPEKKTFATHLHDAGYRTFFAGKYLNRYGDKTTGGLQHIPPGWDEWIALQFNSRYYNYSLSVNGKEEVHGDDYHKDYLTDVINNRSIEFLNKQSSSKPFFAMMSTPACHSPFDSAPQYVSHFTDKKAPRGPSFNVHSTDKHWLIRRAENPMSNGSITYLDDAFRKRWRTLLSVDDMVKNVVTLLEKKKFISNTFIIFSSDNGFHLGQFSLPNDKRQLYEFDIRVPLIVRGPGVPPGSTSDKLAANVDIMPTIVDIATGKAPSDVDGMSLVPLLIPPNTTNRILKKEKANIPWRQEILIEHTGEWNADGYGGCPHTEFLSNCHPSCVCEDSRNNSYSCLRVLDEEQNNVYCEFSDAQSCHPSCVCEDARNNTYECIRTLAGTSGANHMYCNFADGETCYPSCICEDGRNNSYTCVRTLSPKDSFVYCNFADNENFQEFYNITEDPHQMTNIIGKLDPKFVTAQNEKLIVLSMCQGASCRQVIPTPPRSKHANSIDAA